MEGKVTYVKVLGISFLIGALFILFASLSVGPSLNTITGVLILIVAIIYLVNPAATYDNNGFKTKNLYGMTLKTYTFSADEIVIRDQKIYVNDKKVRLNKGMLVQKEYKNLLDHIASHSDAMTEDELMKSQSKSDEDDVLDSDMIEKK